MNNDIYDIGFVCGMTHNIGNNLTNYALYQYLCDLELNVLPILVPLEFEPEGNNPSGVFDLFINNPFDEFVYSNDKDVQLNDICQKFIVGSDQVFRLDVIEQTNYHMLCDWINSTRYKIAYAASFGLDRFMGSKVQTDKTRYLLHRFQKLSLREKTGVEIIKNKFGLEAEWVLDPVFLCDREHYINMAKQGQNRIPNTKYIGAYLLDSTIDEEKIITHLGKKINVDKFLTIFDAEWKYYEFNQELNSLNNPKIEEWLAMINNCDFFVADSYHGMCFALMFHKPFCIVFPKDNSRGLTRIETLLKLLNLEDRLVCSYEEFLEKQIHLKEINYEKVDKILTKEIYRSKQWLNEALKEGDNFNCEYNTFDYFIDELKKVNKLKSLLYHTRNELFMTNKKLLHDVKNFKKGAKKDMTIVCWGTGLCFRNNCKLIKKYYPLKYVCDNDPDKWGTTIADGVTCISPQKLKEMEDVLVIVSVDNIGYAFEIINQLLAMGINNFDHIYNWIKFMEDK